MQGLEPNDERVSDRHRRVSQKPGLSVAPLDAERRLDLPGVAPDDDLADHARHRDVAIVVGARVEAVAHDESEEVWSLSTRFLALQ